MNSEKKDYFELYKIALDTRNFEIELFWKRSNYFLVLNSLLAAAFIRFYATKESLFLSCLLIVFGFVASFLWFRVNLGSKFWQTRWEEKLLQIEKKIDSDLKFFNTSNEPKQDVKNNFERAKKENLFTYLILTKPSVSNQMIYLSLVFILFWMSLFGYVLCNKII